MPHPYAATLRKATAVVMAVSAGTMGACINLPDGARQQVCNQTSTDEISQAENILSGIAKRPSSLEMTDDIGAHKATIAASLGVTIYDDANIVAELTSIDGQVPFSEYLKTANAYTKLFGVTIEVIRPGDPALANDDATVPSLAELEGSSAKAAVMSTVQSLSDLPVEYIRQNDWNRVVLQDRNAIDIADFDYNIPDTMFVNLKQFSSQAAPDIIRHELTHMDDNKSCGENRDASDDPQYIAENHGDIYSGTVERPPLSADQPISLGSAMKQLTPAISNMYVKSNIMTRAAYCKTMLHVASVERSIKTTSDYAYRSVVEDKAELGIHLLSPSGYADIIASPSPTIRRKAAILFARMMRQSPRTAKYFASTAYPPATPAYDCSSS